MSTLPDNTRIRENFTYGELKCHCGCGQMLCTEAALDKLQLLRSILGRPVKLSSAYRCPEYNARVSHTGKSIGAHSVGEAFDIVCAGEFAYSVLQAAIIAGFTRIGINQKGDYAARFIHVDNWVDEERGVPNPTIWSY